jgi:pimeloyl-ACP methyl ester carboxylesterase
MAMRLAVTEAGRGAAGRFPVVLLHGLLGAGQNFGAVQKALAASGHRVLALDLRNHGASPHAPSMSYPGMAADVAETLRAAGAWPAAVIGHSMGGKAAMALALAQPEGVGRLLVADIAPVTYRTPLFATDVAAMRAIPLRAGLTRREDLFIDDIHLNETGFYLVALIHYATIYQRDPTGLPGGLIRTDGAAATPLAPVTAKALQQLVWDTVPRYAATGMVRGIE